MKLCNLTEHTDQALLHLTEDLLESSTPAEIGYELETVMAVYLQYAPVSRLTLANTSGLITKLIVYFTRLETLFEEDEITPFPEEFTD